MGHPEPDIRILIVEDENLVAQDLRNMLVTLGYDVGAIVPSGERALEMIASSPPHLILMDIAIQGRLDGIETAAEIHRLYRLPIIFITALGDALTLQRAKVTEPFGYLYKPFEQREIHAAIEMALYKHVMETQLRESEASLRRSERMYREAGDQLQKLSRHLQDIREKERTRLAHELHDELGQILTAMKMDAAWLLAKIPVGEKNLRARAADLSNLADQTLKTVRRLVQEMRPGVLDDLGLTAALEWQADEFAKRTGIRCRVQSVIDENRLSKDQATALFRIVQESLTNASRHSGATEVSIILNEAPRSISLRIADNGRGITEEEIRAGRSLGLLGMRERAAAAGGTFAIAGRAAGEGTTVSVEIPTTPGSDGP